MDSASFFALLLVLGTMFFMAYRKYRLHQNNKVMVNKVMVSSLSPSSLSSSVSPSSLLSPVSPLSLSSSVSPSSLPSSVSHNWEYRVFPSFCGEDIRMGFFSHFLERFERIGISLVIDSRESISHGIVEAIRRSRIAVVLLTRNYASSTFLLNELVEIMKCRAELGQIVIPIFYNMTPSHVKKLRGSFGSVFKKVCAGKSVEDVEKWKQALEQVTQIVGYVPSKWQNEAAMIEKIAVDVANKLNKVIPSKDFDGFVGMENHIMQMSSLLSLDSDDVRMIGIWGPAGIGKTTIARALYHKLSNKFTHAAFVESARGSPENKHKDDHEFMMHLQEQLLSKTFDHEDLKIHHLYMNKKALVVLDDVDDLRQLQAMAGETQWFGPGSRIIITTKDRSLLKAHGIKHIYNVDFPCSSEALEIFCQSAFDQKSPEAGYEELTMEIIGLAGNLPLGLRDFGSYLQRMSKEEWMHALPRLTTSLDTNVEKVLRCSYEALCNKDKNLFLHIACFFKGENNSLVEFSELDLRHGLQVLAEKALISIDKGARLVMHNLLEQLGIEIARKKYRNVHGRRKFLMDAQEICDVLANSPGSGSVLGTNHIITEIEEGVEKWKHTLGEVALIPSYNSREWENEVDMVETVGKDVANMFNYPLPPRDFDRLVGMENHITHVSSLLSLDSNDVRMVGIWGPAGIGKTTIARALYQKLSNKFIYTAFMESTRSPENKHRDDREFKLHLQEQLLSKTFDHKDLKINHLGVAEKRLKDKKVLVVLDDVYELRQLEAMAGKTQWFGPGSRIIITTTDRRLLKAHGIDHIYHVGFPCSSEALGIFCQYAFDQKSPKAGFEELTMEIIRLAGNLPLGLHVFGSYLRRMSQKEWMQALPRLRTSLDRKIACILMGEYEGLFDEDKDLFIHIACIFNGKKSSILSKYISNLDVTHGLQVLVDKSLISIDKDERLVMHNLLVMLGKETASNEYIDVHGTEDASEVCDDTSSDTSSCVSTENITCEGIADPSTSCTHQVFPSFHGVDVRETFLPHMLKEFSRKGITPFIDNDIERSKSIGPELKKAIKGSRISVAIISKNYASSTWCLDELVKIMKCRKKSSQIVTAVFYDVEPSDVKKQRGYFGSVFEETCVDKPGEAVEKWKKALEEVAQIAGYDSSTWKNDAVMVEKLAIDVANKLNMATPSRDFDGLVGMDNHITEISTLLSLDSNDVRMIGIWGPAGIGKTTIARALYHKLSNKFIYTAFIESTRGSPENKHKDDHDFKLHLQEQLLSKTFDHKDLKIHHLGVAEERLKDKKVLIVLDDVDDLRQLQAMAGKTQWFGSGSRIIITTKDTRPLKAHGIMKDHIYTVKVPRPSEALEIFCQSAFDQKSLKAGYEDLTMEIVGLAGNLPLGLSVFGSYLRGMSKEEWMEALPRFRTSLDGKIETVLMFSYNSLSRKDKDLFLHIACLFVGESTSYVKKCLAHSDLDAKHGFKVLEDKSLISISQEELLMMHNLVEKLGKEIVRKEHERKLIERKFLVDAWDIRDVLAENTGTGSVLGIDLNIAAIKDELCIDKKAFKGMPYLQFLRFKSPYVYGTKNNKLILPEGLKILPRKLSVLRWDEFPLTCLPPNFLAEFLVILEMRNSCIEKLWEGAPSLQHLTLMDMSYSLNLKEVPNLSNAKKLETLILNACESLVEIPTWFQNLSSLEQLKMVGCKKLEVLPTNINLKSLHHLDLSHCTQLKTFPEISTNIGYLDLENTGVEEVPSSIRSWPNLSKLGMPGYKSLRMFPDVLDSMVE